jgi:uncharacterized protein YjbI with pentapeptide repeats
MSIKDFRIHGFLMKERGTGVLLVIACGISGKSHVSHGQDARATFENLLFARASRAAANLRKTKLSFAWEIWNRNFRILNGAGQILRKAR